MGSSSKGVEIKDPYLNEIKNNKLLAEKLRPHDVAGICFGIFVQVLMAMSLLFNV